MGNPAAKEGGSGASPFDPGTGGTPRRADASRFGTACGHAAGTTDADAVGSHECGVQMNCGCSQCSVEHEGRTRPAGKALDAVPIQGMQHAMNLYHAFNGFEPSRVLHVRHPRVIPPLVVELGELVGLMYRSGKGRPGQPLTYIHRMENPPHIVSEVAGTQLYVVGGSYRVTPRGIEG